jgi:uncharacterized SAM-binding protein YcdF (DUF218 family)
MDSNVAENINILAKFLGTRDIDVLNQEELFERYGIHQADVMVLFGGSIVEGGDVLASGIKNFVAKKYIIVGGAGHTTDTLRQVVHLEYPDIETTDLSEAEIFQKYIKHVYGCKADYLETKSTNCGNNITYLLDLLKENNISFNSIILSQDASMQRRMAAGLKKYVNDNVTIINYATYCAKVLNQNDELVYEENIHGMWTIERYVNLLMGEIPRLSDDENGYGPNGKNYIAHVDIPEYVKIAFEELKMVFGSETREANPLYATNMNKK